MMSVWSSRRLALSLGGLALATVVALLMGNELARGAPDATVRMGSGQVAPAATIVLPLEALGVLSPGLAAATIDVRYDPAVLDATACSGDPGSILDVAICSVTFDNDDTGTDAVRLTLLDTVGESGDLLLANISFQAVGSHGDTSALDVVIETFVDFDGADITVTDQDGSVTINTTAPTADAGADQKVNPSAAVALDGSASSDPDGDTPITYAWTKTSGPAVTLTGATTAGPTFTAPGSGVLVFQLIVTDSLSLDSAADSVTVTVNQAPTADAGADQKVNPSAAVTLVGGGSSDPDGDTPITYAWTKTSGPAVTLTGATTAGPTFTAPSPGGVLTFQLVVTDSLGLASAADSQVRDQSDPTPDADGYYGFRGLDTSRDPETAESGNGVLGRVTLEAIGPGISTISVNVPSISPAFHDAEFDYLEPFGKFGTWLGDVFDSRIAVDEPCPSDAIPVPPPPGVTPAVSPGEQPPAGQTPAAGSTPGATPVPTISPGANTADAIRIDSDPSGNAATSLGSIDVCREVALGEQFDVDLVIEDVSNLLSFSATLIYDEGMLQVVGEDVSLFLASAPASDLSDTSDSLPDSDGVYEVRALDLSTDPAAAESGSGILARLTLEGASAGVSTLSVQVPSISPILTDTGGNALEPADAFGAWGKTLTAPDQLKPALEEAFKQEGPAIIGVPIDYDENMKLTKRLGELAFTI